MFNHATVENFKTVLTYLTSQETALKFINVIGPFVKKTIESFVLKNPCDWIICFQEPGFERSHCKKNLWRRMINAAGRRKHATSKDFTKNKL